MTAMIPQRQKGKVLSVLFGVLMFHASAHPEEEAALEPETRGVLRVISYNVQFLPGIARNFNKRPDPEYRAREIAEAVSEYDVVGLNEVFDEEHRDILLEELRRFWGNECHVVTHEKPAEGGFYTSGGLMIASRLPILESNQTTYTAFSRPEDHGFRADGFASKGVLHARLLRKHGQQEDYLDVFVTHMEARDDDLRPQQIRELAAFVGQHGGGEHPVVIMGDMNIDGRMDPPHEPEPQYATLMSVLAEARKPATVFDAWVERHGAEAAGVTVENGKRIDHIFVSNPATDPESVSVEELGVQAFPDARVGSLSDHSAVEAEIRWKLKGEAEE